MRLTVKLFGPQAVQARTRDQVVELPEGQPTIGELRRRLAEVQPALTASLPTSRFAINCEFVGDDAIVRSGDEVALLGMLSGG